MRSLPFALVTALCCAATFADEALGATNLINQFAATLIKEPAYHSTPKLLLDHTGRYWRRESVDGRGWKALVH
jgi:hypothetical protein